MSVTQTSPASAKIELFRSLFRGREEVYPRRFESAKSGKAGALPGWPVAVPLPIDPQWKQDYAASVKRLIRDGVDQPLAQLFVHAARPLVPDAEGANRARSASEAFIFRRFETLPELTGRFRLNALLPIPFDDRGRMEIDLLCEAAQLAVEIDGLQHLGDAVAYRRDRRKDALLQAHGYFVLRFLADDIGKHLDVVLDTVLRTLVSRSRLPASEKDVNQLQRLAV